MIAQAYRRARAGVALGPLESAVRARDRARAARPLLLASDRAGERLSATLPAALLAALGAGGREVAGRARFAPPRPRVAARATVRMGFDGKNPEAQVWAREHAAETITRLSELDRQTIRETISVAFEEGIPPGKAARMLRSVVGLTESQAARVLDGEDAEEMLASNALRLARTESMTAVNEGSRQFFLQAVEEGLLTGREEREWVASSDACPTCDELDGTTATLDGHFKGGAEPGSVHPNCRCTFAVVPLPASERDSSDPSLVAQ